MSIVPEKVKLAAKRGFIRTTTQAYAATIPAGGISAAALAQYVEDPDPLLITVAAVTWFASPLLAGLVSYLDIIGKGVPEDYQV